MAHRVSCCKPAWSIALSKLSTAPSRTSAVYVLHAQCSPVMAMSHVVAVAATLTNDFSCWTSKARRT